MSFTLIVPAAANKQEYEDTIPHIFRLDEKGIAYCIKAILGMDLSAFTTIYFTILHQHDERYGVADMLRIQLNRLQILNAKIIILDSSTSSQSATIHETIVNEHITGPIFVKDADSYFCAKIHPQNGIVVYPLEKLSHVNPQHKSYVAVDDMLYITNMIEKRIVDHYFNAGGYCFDNASTFCSYYQRYAQNKGLCLSHIVFAMLLDKHIFKPFLADSYQDFELKIL